VQVKLSEYNNMKSQLNAAMRKSTGSLAVRDLKTIVKKEQVISSENLTTLFVVVSRFSLKEWETSYESLCDFVVSGQQLIRTCPLHAYEDVLCDKGFQFEAMW
jgi:V-type H+-transporting ATPase subunit C